MGAEVGAAKMSSFSYLEQWDLLTTIFEACKTALVGWGCCIVEKRPGVRAEVIQQCTVGAGVGAAEMLRLCHLRLWDALVTK